MKKLKALYRHSSAPYKPLTYGEFHGILAAIYQPLTYGDFVSSLIGG